jgi:hypothetical protein
LITDDGIYFSDGKLLISASGIKTGVITSKNNNMTIDLDDGEIVCNTFRLRASTPISTYTRWLVLDNNPTGTSSYFYVGT